MPYKRQNKQRTNRRPANHTIRRPNRVLQMMGHGANRALEYAKNIPGPLGVVARSVGFMKNLINVETKYLDTTQEQVVAATTPAWFLAVNSMAEGDDYNQRNGRSVLNQSLTINWLLKMAEGATSTNVRIVIVCDKKPDVGSVQYDTVFGSGSNVLTQIDKANDGDRFVILRSMLLSLSNGNNQTQNGKIHINLVGTHTLFDATTANVEKNLIYILAKSDQDTQMPELYVNSRFRYTDN